MRPIKLVDQENNPLYVKILLKTVAIVINCGRLLTFQNIIFDGSDLPYESILITDQLCKFDASIYVLSCCNPERDYEDINSPCNINERIHRNLNKQFQRHCFIEGGSSEIPINIRILNSKSKTGCLNI